MQIADQNLEDFIEYILNVFVEKQPADTNM